MEITLTNEGQRPGFCVGKFSVQRVWVKPLNRGSSHRRNGVGAGISPSGSVYLRVFAASPVLVLTAIGENADQNFPLRMARRVANYTLRLGLWKVGKSDAKAVVKFRGDPNEQMLGVR